MSNSPTSTPASGFRSRNITTDDLIAKARRILHPHTLDVKEIAWWSVYEIGQRLYHQIRRSSGGDVRNTSAPRIHRRRRLPHPQPESGPGHERLDAGRLQSRMEARFRACGSAARRILLHSYSAERQAVAKELIDFDREWAEILASAKGDNKGADAAETQNYFVRHGRYTAGTATRYHPIPPHRRAGPPASRQGICRSARAFTPRRSFGSRTPSRFILATSSRRTAASGFLCLPAGRSRSLHLRLFAPCAVS